TNVLQNLMYGTRLLINPDIPETMMLRKRGGAHSLSMPNGQPSSIVDEFLCLTERKTIEELRDIEDVGFYVVIATVLAVDSVPSGWYKSCVCNRKVEARNGMWFCNCCDKYVKNLLYRYKLDLVAYDGTAATTFIVYDREATILLGWTCSDLIQELN
ncbi:hypothetical protein PIB30_109806, partial [Stylosanthes scabra]|nr:hypothetical protein [Stylosanthes scabra]